ncbi:hypothetical protein FHS55_004559, partial [Angulomicrobium tetraedrale]|nr:hypothetical protein [Ancylobacter tetraedralis]
MSAECDAQPGDTTAPSEPEQTLYPGPDLTGEPPNGSRILPDAGELFRDDEGRP